MEQAHASVVLDRVARNSATITAVLHGVLWGAPLVLAAWGSQSLMRAIVDQDLEVPPFTELVLNFAGLVLRFWYLFPLLFLPGMFLDGWLLYRLGRRHGLHAKAARRVWSVVAVMLPLVLSGFVVIAYLLPLLAIIGKSG
jgi:hypothetical protein